MKNYFFLLPLFFLLFSLQAVGQRQNQSSDLRSKVDSIIQKQLHYTIDSTTSALPTSNWDTTRQRGLYPSFSNFSSNPLPLIMLNGHMVKIDSLNTMQLDEIAELSVLLPDDSLTVPLYGVREVNGAIIMYTSPSSHKEHKK